MGQQRPDKQDQVTGMFSKIAREADRQERNARRDARKRGEFYKIANPELLSITEQEKYYQELWQHEQGGDQYKKFYDRDSPNFPFAYKFRTVVDK